MYRRLQNLQISSVIVCSEWDRLEYNTVLTAEKRGPQIVGAEIAGVYCIQNLPIFSNFYIQQKCLKDIRIEICQNDGSKH